MGLRLGSSEGASREGRSRLGASCRLFVSHRSPLSCSRTTSLRPSTSKITSSFLWVSPSWSRTRATARRPARLARRPENVLVVGAIPAAAQRPRAGCQATSASLRASCARAHAGEAQVRLPLPPPPSPSLVVSPSRTVEAHDVQTFTYQLILPPGSNSPCSWRTKPGSLTLSEASTCDDDDEEARSGRGPAAGAGPLAPRQQQPHVLSSALTLLSFADPPAASPPAPYLTFSRLSDPLDSVQLPRQRLIVLRHSGTP